MLQCRHQSKHSVGRAQTPSEGGLVCFYDCQLHVTWRISFSYVQVVSHFPLKEKVKTFFFLVINIAKARIRVFFIQMVTCPNGPNNDTDFGHLTHLKCSKQQLRIAPISGHGSRQEGHGSLQRWHWAKIKT